MSTSTSRIRAAAIAGHAGDEATARTLLDDTDPHVVVAALTALVRMERASTADIDTALTHPDAIVRRRALELAASMETPPIISLLRDSEDAVVEMAAWALGERSSSAEIVTELCRVVADHADALCREAAVAALGALGDPAALPTILAACEDKATVRRRAVLALAPFEGPEVQKALQHATSDRDWQVRQAAEDLLLIDANPETSP